MCVRRACPCAVYLSPDSPLACVRGRVRGFRGHSVYISAVHLLFIVRNLNDGLLLEKR